MGGVVPLCPAKPQRRLQPPRQTVAPSRHAPAAEAQAGTEAAGPRRGGCAAAAAAAAGWTVTDVDDNCGAVVDDVLLLLLPPSVRSNILKEWMGDHHGRAPQKCFWLKKTIRATGNVRGTERLRRRTAMWLNRPADAHMHAQPHLRASLTRCFAASFGPAPLVASACTASSTSWLSLNSNMPSLMRTTYLQGGRGSACRHKAPGIMRTTFCSAAAAAGWGPRATQSL